MKKIARVFVIAIFVPSLLLAWLAVRSLRDQQLILERQQSLLYQGVADALAGQADNILTEQLHEFADQVETLLASSGAQNLSTAFDDRLRSNWPCADVGFVVTLNGQLSCPTPTASPAASAFCVNFGEFLGNRQSAEVYVNTVNTKGGFNTFNPSLNGQDAQVSADNNNNGNPDRLAANNLSKGQQQIRNVVPQKQSPAQQGQNPISKVWSGDFEFHQLVGDSTDGTVARFVNNKLNVLMWHRSPRNPNVIFGAQLSLPRLKQRLQPVVERLVQPLRSDIAVALLDDTARPVAISHPGFAAAWKHPFVATEIGEALPHWELAVYLLDPAKIAQSARNLEVTLGLLIALLLIAIGVGGWLIVADLNRQLTLARQKTDFVSNVSHELKTPLTSIRMFSELLAEGRVVEPAKRQSYLNIISAETSRLTRLINNVLDFSRMERGEKKYNFAECDLSGLVRETIEAYRPHLESNRFNLQLESAGDAIMVNGDRDALAQVVVNLLSNAEKYSDGGREIIVQLEQLREPLPHVEVRVLDRGTGVPRGCEDRIFEKFYRAHDSLSSGIQGSGLGLTLARQIARAHGGDVTFRPRDGGGSCFILRLPARTA